MSLKELPLGNPRLRASASSLTASSGYVLNSRKNGSKKKSGHTYSCQRFLGGKHTVTLKICAIFWKEHSDKFVVTRCLYHYVQMTWTHIVTIHEK